MGVQPPTTQPTASGCAAGVPSISEISSQSSDEDIRGMRKRRRVGEGDTQTLPSSSLVRYHSAHLPVQQLDQPPSESSGTEGAELAVVPDPEVLRKIALEKANRNPQAVPKVSSKLRKELVSSVCCYNVLF